MATLVQIMVWCDEATSHDLTQWCLVYCRIYASLGLNELKLALILFEMPSSNAWCIHENECISCYFCAITWNLLRFNHVEPIVCGNVCTIGNRFAKSTCTQSTAGNITMVFSIQVYLHWIQTSSQWENNFSNHTIQLVAPKAKCQTTKANCQWWNWPLTPANLHNFFGHPSSGCMVPTFLKKIVIFSFSCKQYWAYDACWSVMVPNVLWCSSKQL